MTTHGTLVISWSIWLCKIDIPHFKLLSWVELSTKHKTLLFALSRHISTVCFPSSPQFSDKPLWDTAKPEINVFESLVNSKDTKFDKKKCHYKCVFSLTPCHIVFQCSDPCRLCYSPVYLIWGMFDWQILTTSQEAVWTATVPWWIVTPIMNCWSMENPSHS